MSSIPDGTSPPENLAPAPVEAWLRRHPRRVVAALAGAAVFVRLIFCLQVASGPLPRIHALWPETDNAFFDAWGQRLAAGDWLQRGAWHPMASWMEVVAGQALAEDPALPHRLGVVQPPGASPAVLRALLWDRWLGGPAFFQEPGYPYLVGLTYRLAGPEGWSVFAWQLALGVAFVLLVHGLARRLFSHAAAAVAGVLAVLAPVPLFFEVTLLRDSVVTAVTLALALLMHWAVEGPRRRWLVLGLGFGAAALLKQTFVLLPVLLACWRLVTVRSAARDRVAAAGLVLAGMAVALLPASLRNLAVGVPALALNGSAAAMLPVFHTRGATPFLINVDQDYVRILLAAGGSPFRSLLEAARTHASAWGFAGLQLQKVAFAWHGFEAPNNVDFYLFRQAAPLLGYLPARLPLLAPLAAIGLASAPRRAWPLVLTLLASLAGVVAATALSRYRAPLLASLLPLAGAGVVQLVGWSRARRWKLLGGAALASAAYLAWATGEPPARSDRVRAAEYRSAAEWFAPRSASLAALNLLEANRLAPGSARVELRLGELLLASGDAEGAILHFQAGLAQGGTADARLLYARALVAAGRRSEAQAVVDAILASAPGHAGASALQRRLEGRSDETPDQGGTNR
jgi:4-amino-4-deoxy-L-arabinose transferase-like glycosyltransferase